MLETLVPKVQGVAPVRVRGAMPLHGAALACACLLASAARAPRGRSAPGDADGDGTDDLAELRRTNVGARAPLNKAGSVTLEQGATALPDKGTFQTLAVDEVYVKFIVAKANVSGPDAAVYFVNSTPMPNTCGSRRRCWAGPFPTRSVRGTCGGIVYHPNPVAPSGDVGTFRYTYEPYGAWPYQNVVRSHELLAASMPFLRNNLVYYPKTGPLPRNEEDKASYDASRVPVYLAEDLTGRSVFRPLNAAVGYGLLRVAARFRAGGDFAAPAAPIGSPGCVYRRAVDCATKAALPSGAKPVTGRALLACALLGALSTRTGAQAAQEAVSFSVGADDRVRIEVPSATDRYHVLYYRADDAATEYPVAIHPGEEGTVTLTEPLRAGSTGSYRVATFSNNAPGDADGDGADDLAELRRADPGDRAPLNRAETQPRRLGATAMPDLATFQELSHQGAATLVEAHLKDLEHLKFMVVNADGPDAAVYYMNSNTLEAHWYFGYEAFGWGPHETYNPQHMRGEIIYHPNLVAPSGEVGAFLFRYQPWDSWPFANVARSAELIARSMPFLRNNLVYGPGGGQAVARYEAEKASYDASRVPVYLDDDVAELSVFRPLNAAVGYGLLRVVDGERPTFRDVVILRRLPNELSAVAGVISLEPQTPLSHVNLRAVQDGVPNAYLGNALDDPAVAGLVGRYVRFEVSASSSRPFSWTDPATGETVERAGFSITEATAADVAAHHAARRPAAAQTPARNLTVTAHRALSAIAFADADAFGVKAANLAVLRAMALAEVEVPDGHAVPFHYYDAFMTHNGFHADVDALLADAGFRGSIAVRDAELKKLRRRIRNGAVPAWMETSLEALRASFPAGTSIRCRSSTNNEDLPGFSGAGLYDSVTHTPGEGALSKSVKQVFASLWNLRAFEEREFHRVDHKAAAMGVLMHPNFQREKSNGVAVSDDPVYGTEDTYYVNAQVGEELVTNPSSAAVPEELLLGAGTGDEFTTTVVARSNLVADGARVLGDAHVALLRAALGRIHAHFATLYAVDENEEFAMEIEFKVTASDRLAIKQARPWVY